MSHTFRIIIVWSCVIALITQSGCATIPPPYLPEEVRAQLGNVAIVPARFRPDADLSVPAKGSLAGAWRKSARWAGKGALAPLEGVNVCSGDSSGLCGALIIALSVTAGTIGGLVGGWLAGTLFHVRNAVNGVNLGSIVVAFLGAIVAIMIVRALPGRSPL